MANIFCEWVANFFYLLCEWVTKTFLAHQISSQTSIYRKAPVTYVLKFEVASVTEQQSSIYIQKAPLTIHIHIHSLNGDCNNGNIKFLSLDPPHTHTSPFLCKIKGKAWDS